MTNSIINGLLKIPATAVFAAYVAFFALRNYFTPLTNDDYSYSFMWDGAHGGNVNKVATVYERISSFEDIWLSQWSHYFTWGGRTVAHTTDQFFLWIGKPAFDIASTFVFAVLLLSIYQITIKPMRWSRISARRLTYIFFGIWFCVPVFTETMLWMTGACNYLWMTTLQIIFLLPYINAFTESLPGDAKIVSAHRESSEIKFVFMIFAGIIAGWSNEAGAIATIFLAAFFIFFTKQRAGLQSWQVAGFVALVIGFLFMMFSPGNLARMSYAYDTFRVDFGVMYQHLRTSIPPFVKYESVLFLPIIYLVYKYFGAGILRKKFDDVNFKIVVAFTSASIIVLAALLFSPEFPLRAGFPSPIFLIIASLTAVNIIVKEHLLESGFLKSVVVLACVFITALGVVSTVFSMSVDWKFLKQMRNRYHIIERQHDNDLVVVPKIHRVHSKADLLGARTAYYYYFHKVANSGISEDPNFYRNVEFARYYGLKQVKEED